MRLFHTSHIARRVTALSISGLLGLAVLAPVSASAQESIQQTIQFKKGTSSLKVNGKVKGYQTADYKVTAAEGQLMTVRLQSKNPSLYFTITPPNGQEALFDGTSEGSQFEGYLPEKGTYTIRVFLMRNAARRNEVARYSLNTRIVNQ